MGSEMDAALGAYGDATDLVFLAFGLIWLAVGVLIMRNEEVEDGR
jgi:hypothetical protein